MQLACSASPPTPSASTDMPKHSRCIQRTESAGPLNRANWAQRGSGRLIVVLLLVAMGFAGWLALGPKAPMAAPEALEPAAAAPTEPAPGMSAESEVLALEANGPRTVGGIEPRPIGGHEKFTKAFGDTGGTIVGEIRVEGADYPETWTVTLEPSLAAEGREEAIEKSFTAEPGMRTFELRDLPMAAYRLSATAPGLTTKKVEVALYRIEGRPTLRGLDFVSVDLTLRPMARVEGFVRQSTGDAADDLTVFLTPLRVPGTAKVSKAELDDSGNVTIQYKTRTNASGSYSFVAIPPGPWLLLMGDPLNPLVPGIPVVVDKSDQRLQDVELPPLAELELVVLDHLARPCPGVDVTGYLREAGSGSLRTKTDGVGIARVRYLTPGPWRVNVDDTEFDQSGQGDFVLRPGGRTDGRMEEIQVR